MLEKYLPSPRDTWAWRNAQSEDITDIVNMAVSMFQHEIQPVFTPDPKLLSKHLAQAIAAQTYAPLEQQVIVARDRTTDALVAWAWLGRGGYAVYAPEECAEAHFAHIDLNLSTRARVTIMAQILQQWVLWCMMAGVPVLVSTSIREDQKGFFHIHEAAGFMVRGSLAYLRVK